MTPVETQSAEELQPEPSGLQQARNRVGTLEDIGAPLTALETPNVTQMEAEEEMEQTVRPGGEVYSVPNYTDVSSSRLPIIAREEARTHPHTPLRVQQAMFQDFDPVPINRRVDLP